MNPTIVTAPAEEPLQLAEVKAHLRVSVADEDALIQRLIVAVRRKVEADCGLALVTQTLDATYDRWPCDGTIRLPRGPVASVTSVKYVSAVGVLSTLPGAQYETDLTGAPARIRPAYGYTWPTILPTLGAVVVRFVAGYGDRAAVPADIKAAMLMMIGHLYEHREDVADFQVYHVPKAADWLLAPHKVHWF
jgi:uncharacterized phiE125 gp8 family phage protein